MKIIKLLFFLIFTYIYSSNIYGQVYCNASSTSNVSNSNDYISKVEFGSISNTSFNTTYSNFTSLSTTINKGIASTLTITLNNTNGGSNNDSDQVLVWIDWNKDGDFLDSGEAVYTSPLGVGPFTASITAPFSAVLGNTRMRIRLHDSSFGPNSTSCGISDYGEVEDYTVNVSSIVPSVPNACAASSITAFGYDFISKVEIGTILKNSGYSNYSDYTNNTIVTNMTRGVASPFTITLGGYPIPGDLSDQIFIWIDWNHDGDFIDSGESVYTSIVSVGPFTGSITPPNTALLGGARMRIRLHDTDYGPNSTPCGTSDYGEVEDYVINLQTPFLTVSSNALTIGAPANSTATFGITSNVTWNITNSEPTWLSLSNNSGSNNGTITLTAAANPLTSTRTATLVVSGSGVTSQTITVTQDAGSATLNVSTTSATNISTTTVATGGDVTSVGGGNVTSRGVCYGIAANPTISGTKTSNGTGTGTFSSAITGLSPQTLYYYRAYATNSFGTSYGPEYSFYTLATEPTGHSASFTATAVGPNQINLSFSAASAYGADGYLILGYIGSSIPSSSGVLDGIPSSSFSLTSPVSVITNINSTSATSYIHNSLIPNSQYYYIIIPYNWDLINTATYNYLTAATIPSATATTPSGPSAEGLYISGNLVNNGSIVATLDENYIRMIGTTKSISGTGTFTDTKLYVDGTITFSGTFVSGAMSETYVNTSKSIEIATGKTYKNGLFTNYGSLILTGTGIWQNSGNYSNYSTVSAASTSTTVFNGSSAQTLNGSVNTVFGNVTMNNTAGLTVTKGFTVNTVLTFTAGNILAASSSEAVTFETSGTAVGAADTRCIVGFCKKNTNSVTKFTFPVGTTSLFRPASITPSSTSATTWTTKYYGAGYGTYNVTGASIHQPSKREYWTIDRSGASNATIELSWGSNSNVYSPNTSDLIVAHYTGTAWENAGGNNISGTTTGVVSSNSNWSTYSPFTLGSKSFAITLPITLVSFEAKPINKDVKIIWQTASEIDVNYFTIERSQTGNDFKEIGKINGSGTSTHVINYNLIDSDYDKTILYYRLKLTNFDGDESYSNIVSLDMTDSKSAIFLVKTTNTLGQEVNETTPGFVFDLYSDGSIVKRLQ